MQIAKWGNSLAVRIPADMARELGLKEGDEIQLRALTNGEVGVLSEQQRRDEAARGLREIGQRCGLLPADFKFDRDWANSRGDE